MAIVISFLGVGMVAIPTGIISAGFVERYTRAGRESAKAREKSLSVISCVIEPDHPWHNKEVRDIVLPPQTVIISLMRGSNEIVPEDDTVLLPGDTLILGDELKVT
jgi:voltage-gated potassium channel